MPVSWSNLEAEQNQEEVASSCCPFFLNILYLPASPSLCAAIGAINPDAVSSSLSIPLTPSSRRFRQAGADKI